jgi:hypothetical protein
MKAASWDGDGDVYALARWGDALEAFPVLMSRAVKRWKERTLARMKAIESDLARDRAIVESATGDTVPADGADVPAYYYSGLRR